MAEGDGGNSGGGGQGPINPTNIDELIKRFAELGITTQAWEEKLRDVAKNLKDISGIAIDTSGDFDDVAAAIKNVNTFNSETLEQQKEALRIQRNYFETLLRNTDATDEAQRELIKQKLKQLDVEEKQNGIMSEEVENSKRLLKSSLGIQDSKISLFGKLAQINQMGKLNLSNEEKQEMRAQMLGSAFSKVAEKAAALAQAIFNTSLELDNAAKNLMKAGTFSFQEAQTGLLAAAGDAAVAGVSIDALGQSMVTLKNTFTGFTALTQTQRQEVTSLTAVMDKVGFSAGTTAAFFDTATKSMGLSVGQTKNFVSSLKTFADQTGISMQQLDKDLAANMKNIANYGSEGTKVFKEMALASKQLGIEMGTLFAVTEQLTTFQGAAESAAKFNAILGGDFLNSINLLNAAMESPVDVFREYKTAMDQAGVSFDSLDNGMRRVIADAAGMSVLDAGKLFSQDINTATRAMKEQAKTQEELNKIAGEMTGLMDKVKSAFIALYPSLEPLITRLKEAGDELTIWIAELKDYMDENPGFVEGLADVAIAFTAIVGGLALLGPPLLAIYSVFVALKVLFFTAAIGMAAFGGAAGTAAPATVAASGAIVDFGFAVGLASYYAKGAIPIVLAIGAAFLLIGAGIGLAALGLAEVVRAFGEVGNNAWPAAAAIVGITVALAILAYNLMLISPAIGMIGLLAAAFIGLGIAFALISDDFVVLKDMFAEINKFNTSAVNVITNLTSITDAVVEKYSKIAQAFQSIAISAGIIGEIANVVGTPAVAGEVGTTFEVQSQNATVESIKPTEITINLKVDSDVKLDGDRMGKWVREEVVKVIQKSSVR